jgi:hypothetical protein
MPASLSDVSALEGFASLPNALADQEDVCRAVRGTNAACGLGRRVGRELERNLIPLNTTPGVRPVRAGV